MNYLSILLLLTVFSFYAYGKNPGTLKSLLIFVRHGARSPLMKIPALDRITTWKMGYGQLTPIGQRQHYLLGRALRKQYIEDEKFLKPEYNSSEFKVRSTGYTRTVISGDCFLKGFYKDHLAKLSDDQLKNVRIWTPPLNTTNLKKIKQELNESALPFDIPLVPVISYNPDFDKLLEWHSCPQYESYWDKYFKSETYKGLLKKHNESLTWACDQFDIKIDEKQIDYYFYMVDYLLAAEFHGQLKALTNNKKMLKDLTVFNTRMLLEILVQNQWMQQVAMHNFSSYVPYLFERAINNSAEKAFAFFTHDMSMIQFLLGLGVEKESKIFDDIPFASNLILELRKDDNKYNVYGIFNGNLLLNKTLEEFKVDMKKLPKLKRKWIDECRLK